MQRHTLNNLNTIENYRIFFKVDKFLRKNMNRFIMEGEAL